MHLILLEAVVKILGTSLFMVGLWKMFGDTMLRPELEYLYKNWSRKRKLQRLYELNQTKEKQEWEVLRHLRLLLESVGTKDVERSVFNFALLSVSIFSITLGVLSFLLGDFIFASITAFFFSVLPYIFLRFKLANRRLNTSYAFINNFHIILQNYQTTGKNPYRTIMSCTQDIKDKELGIIFMKLLSSFQKQRDVEDFRDSIAVFMFSINSVFAKRFAKMILKAHINNVDISKSLLDLNTDIKKRKKDMEALKTQQMETVFVGFMPILLLPIMLFMSYRIITVYDYWYVFVQPLPLTVFVISLILAVISVLLAYLLRKPRADI